MDDPLLKQNIEEELDIEEEVDFERRIKEALKRSAEVGAKSIPARVKDGKVTLEGRVDS